MLIDLHCHTTKYSACSALSPDDLALAAKAAGLDAVCITEHDAFWPQPLVEMLGEEHGLVVLRGVEVTTEVGHVLVYGLSTWQRGLNTLEALQRFVHEQDGLMFLAHPSRRYARSPDGILGSMFDSLEVLNASEGPLQNSTAAALASQCRLPGIGGSDAHTASEVGAAATRLHGPVRTERELVEELRRARHTTLAATGHTTRF